MTYAGIGGFTPSIARDTRRLNGNQVKKKPEEETTPTPTAPGRAYVDARTEPITAPAAVLLQEEGTDVKFGTGSAGSSTGMFAENTRLGASLDEENRYLRKSGAVLLR